MNKNALTVFIKNSVLGSVKTRLAKSIGAKKALEVYQILVNHAFKTSLPLTCDKFIFYSDKIEQDDNWVQHGYHPQLQQGDDLGERMHNAFQSVFSQHYEKAVLIGSDCYELTSETIERAFSELESNDVVIGPAKDGGYYLLGMKALRTELFKNKKWSTDSVLAETIRDVQASKLKYFLLEELNDIDKVEDLQTPPFDKFIPS